MACARHLPLLLAVLLLAACGGEQRLPQAELTGGTMGTTFRIVLVDAPAGHDLDAQLERVMATLDRVDALASTWRADSELTAFNDALITDWVDVSPAFCGVLQDALAASVASGGAFDVTVGPLVNLWGFGPGGEIDSPPTDAEIAATRERVGYEKLETDCDQARIRKAVERLYVDLSGWAKGYAVDEVAALLDSDGLTHYMVEIGGELKVRGHNAERRRWAIACRRALFAPDRPAQRPPRRTRAGGRHRRRPVDRLRRRDGNCPPRAGPRRGAGTGQRAGNCGILPD